MRGPARHTSSVAAVVPAASAVPVTVDNKVDTLVDLAAGGAHALAHAELPWASYDWRVVPFATIGVPADLAVLDGWLTLYGFPRSWLGRAELPRRGRVQNETCRLIHIVPTHG